MIEDKKSKKYWIIVNCDKNIYERKKRQNVNPISTTEKPNTNKQTLLIQMHPTEEVEDDTSKQYYNQFQKLPSNL